MEAEQYRADDVKVMEAGKPQALVEFASGADFKQWMHVTKTPVIDDGGVSVGILVSVRDITDWKLAEEGLRKHRDHLEELVKERTVQLTAVNEDLYREIQERRRVEEALRQSSENYRNLFEHSPVALINQDGSGVKKFLEDLRSRGVSDLAAHYKQHPETVNERLTMVKLTDDNRQALLLCEAKDKDELARNNAQQVQAARRQLMESVYAIWGDLAQQKPSVAVFDDLHWADAASVDLLQHLFRLCDEVPMLFLCASRPDAAYPSLEGSPVR